MTWQVQGIYIWFNGNKYKVYKMTDLNKKCPTGIPGLDKLLDGGFPRGRNILLSGSCGTGKTIFGVQYLYAGVLQYNEPGILVSLEQEPKELKQDMLNFGFDLQKLENDGKLVIIDASLSRVGIRISSPESVVSNFDIPEGSTSLLPDEFHIERILEIIVSKAKMINAKRVVIDSLPALDFLVKGMDGGLKHMIRQMILAINYRLKANGLTSLLITETPEADGISAHGVESYVADGAIILTVNEALDMRTIKVRKMRQTKHSLKPRIIEFTEKGLVIKVDEEKAGKKLF